MTMRDKAANAAMFGTVTYLLSDLLAARGITVADLAHETGINPVVLKRAIAGETQPSFEQMARICAALNVSAQELIIYTPPTEGE